MEHQTIEKPINTKTQQESSKTKPVSQSPNLTKEKPILYKPRIEKTIQEKKVAPPIVTEKPIIKPPTILSYWLTVNRKNRAIIEVNKNTNQAEENVRIGESFSLSFLANENLSLTLVYIDSEQNMMTVPLTKCCQANKTFKFRAKTPMQIGKPAGTDRINILISKQSIKKSWIKLNTQGKLDENFILSKLTNQENPYFINGKLDLIIH